MASHTNTHSGPIIHLVRHAESEHKPDDSTPNVYAHMKDPILTSGGRKHCIRRNDFLLPQAKHITHILASPLSRALETAFLTFKAVTDRGIKVWALPELQSLSSAPSGIGMNLSDLKSRFDINNSGTKVATKGKSTPENTIKAKQFNVDDFRGKLDLQFMSEDWNDEYENKEGRWSAVDKDWRAGYLKGFFRALRASGERVEIVVVCHSSSLCFLVDDLMVYGDELAFNSFKFDKFSDLVPMSAAAVTRAREQGVGKKPENSIHKPILPSEPFNQLLVKMEVEIEEPLVQVPTVKLPVKKAGKTAGHQMPPTKSPTRHTRHEGRSHNAIHQRRTGGERLRSILEEELVDRAVIPAAKISRKSKIQSKLKLSRSRQVLGKAKVHKKVVLQRKTLVREKHHMVLRNRARLE